MAETDDLGLYAQWREGKSRSAFDELVERYAPMVYSVCRRVLNAQAEAEEAAIEAFQMLAYAPAGPKSHLAAWLHAAATARARQHLRSRRQRPADEPPETAGGPVAWDAVQGTIDSALTAVPWQARIPLIGQYINDKTLAEIAQEIGLDRQRVITDGVTGIEFLRKELAAQGIEISSSHLKELLAAQMLEPVPSGLASRLSERAVADSLAGRRLAAGFEVDETIRKRSRASWALPLGAVAVVAGLIFWFIGGGQPQDVVSPTEPALQEAELAAAPVESPGPRMPRSLQRPEDSAAAHSSPARAQATTSLAYQGVIRDRSGSAVPNARVFLGALPAEPEEIEPAAESGPMGAFDLTEVPTGTRQISVWHAAYKPATAALPPDTDAMLEITLAPAAQVSGIVTHGGSPVARQSVELADVNGKTLRTQTRDDGSYRFTGAEPGLVQLRANLDAVEPANRRRTMYSTALLETGMTTDVDFTFGVLDAAVEGVAMFNDEPARGAKVVARIQTPSGGEEHIEAPVQADGTYLVEAVPSGPAVLQLQGLRTGRTEHLRDLSAQIRSGQTLPCDFMLYGSSSVIVQVSGLPPGATGVVAAIEPGTSLLGLNWPEHLLTPVHLLARIPLGQDGEYALEGLEAGACTICAYATLPAGPAAEPGETGAAPPPLYDAAGLTLQPNGETLIVLQMR
ncbi:MAG: sigma-70 family RNA polymerase sigma factor [Candidatus Hydrogenedentales bacterium]|jgi:RNA polymerase sigma factor (sigma-70 family)